MAKAPRKPSETGRRPDAADPSYPKTTRPAAASRRPKQPAASKKAVAGRRLDAVPDRVDVRDWFYQPRLGALPDQLVNIDLVPMILDQGEEGACTGFALAAVINFLVHRRLGGRGGRPRSVSPRMLYDLARRYDEWPGETYEGSSARGAMKAWVRHGVCGERAWPAGRHGAENLTPDIAKEAQKVPGGAFYRVMHREVRDMHAALAEVGILYVTLMVHDGWSEPEPGETTLAYAAGRATRRVKLPVIRRKGAADSGHAVAIVGYTSEGFIIQNSWGKSWGLNGFALLPYEDYMLHATDVWAAQLGVPLEVDLWERGYAETRTGMSRAQPAVPLADIRPFVVDVGNNGELSQTGDYWTTEEDIARLFSSVIPERAAGWKRRRVLLYLHGGLNSEQATAKRIVAYRDVLLENEIYPLHIMWETSAAATIGQMVADLSTDVDERAGGVADWWRKLRSHLVEAKDRSFELTVSRPGGAMWREMKENARLSSTHPDRRGAMQVMARVVGAVMSNATAAQREGWELHVVAHSAGSIYAANALTHLLESGIPLKSLHMMAPAMTVELFRERMLPLIESGFCPVPYLYVLSDVGERDDDVGPYGKSLLYLVSNAFEDRREKPLLGMERFIRRPRPGEAASGPVDGAVADLLAPRLVVSGEPAREGGLGPSRSDSHGGFDNDDATMNSILRQILGGEPPRAFKPGDLMF